MHNNTLASVYLAACLFAFGAPGLLHAAAPPSAQGAAARVMVRGVELGQATFVTINDPSKTEAIGLSGVQPGQQVEVTRPSEGKWVVKHPQTNKSVTLDKAPDLGQ